MSARSMPAGAVNEGSAAIAVAAVAAVAVVPAMDFMLLRGQGIATATLWLIVLKSLGVIAIVTYVVVRRLGQRRDSEIERDVLEAMHEMVFLTDGDGGFRYVCPNVERETGLDAEYFMNLQQAGRVFDPDPASDLDDGPESIVRNVPSRVRASDGQTRELLLNVHRCNINGGSLLYVGRTFNAFDFAANMLHRIFWHSHDAILFVSDSGKKIVNCNPATVGLFGYRRGELLGRCADVLHIDGDSFDEFFAMRDEAIRDHGYFHIEHSLRHRDGSRVDVDIRTVAVTGDERQGVGWISIVHDISRRRAAEEAVRLIQRVVARIAGCESIDEVYPPVLEAICERSGWGLGEAWCRDAANGGACHRVAVFAADDAARGYLARTADLVPRECAPLVARAFDAAESSSFIDLDDQGEGAGLAGIAQEAGFRGACVLPLIAGGEVWAVLAFYGAGTGRSGQTWLSAIETAISPFAALAARVTSESRLRQKEAEARRAEEDLRRLARRIDELQESERRHLARELHDQMGADLTGLKIRIGLARNALDEPPDAAESSVHLDMARDIADSIGRAIHDLAGRLRPPVLDDSGLVAGIEWLAERFRSHGGCDIALELNVDDSVLDDARSTALFRVCQESLTNVLRHAGASQVSVRLDRHADEIKLCIEDNGGGMDSVVDDANDSLGLIGMRERIQAVGGSLEISGEPGSGTRIVAIAPLPD